MRRLIAFALVAAAGSANAGRCPNIMLVLDQSSSMSQDPNGGTGMPTKFQLLQDAVSQLVNAYGDRVPFGLELFQSDAFRSDAKCYSDTMISVEPAHDTGTKIVQLVKGAGPVPQSHTNTGEAIKRAYVDPVMMDPTRENYIVLVTDGTPSCNLTDLMSGTADYTISELNNARNQTPSVKTFVIGFDGGGTGTDRTNLSAMAQAGGVPLPSCGGNTPCYYPAENAQQLQDVIAKVLGQVTGGEFGGVMCDDSCFASGCPMGQVCVKSEQDLVAKCVPDPCQGAKCSGSQYCRMGQCVSACTNGCKPGTRCENGSCVNDPCWGSTCSSTTGMTCDPKSGQCVADLCAGKSCTGALRCDPSSGKCVDDQCGIITCPAGTKCVAGGNCSGDYARAHGGCAVAPSRAIALEGGIALGALALLVVAAALRRRRA